MVQMSHFPTCLADCSGLLDVNTHTFGGGIFFPSIYVQPVLAEERAMPSWPSAEVCSRCGPGLGLAGKLRVSGCRAGGVS